MAINFKNEKKLLQSIWDFTCNAPHFSMAALRIRVKKSHFSHLRVFHAALAAVLNHLSYSYGVI